MYYIDHFSILVLFFLLIFFCFRKLYSCYHRYFSLPLLPFHTSLLYSNKSSETCLIGMKLDEMNQNQIEKNNYYIMSIGESEIDNVIVAMDAEYKETYALGMCFDTTNKISTAEMAGTQGKTQHIIYNISLSSFISIFDIILFF